MAKGVLGNDPFRRSAAPRPEAPAPAAAPATTSSALAPKVASKDAGGDAVSRPAATPPKKTAPAKASAPGKKDAGARGTKPIHPKDTRSGTTQRGQKAPAAKLLAPAPPGEEHEDTAKRRTKAPVVRASAPVEPDEAREGMAKKATREETAIPVPVAAREVLSEGEAANDLPGAEPTFAAQAPLLSRAAGALALARDILLQTLDRPGLKRVSDVAEGLALALRTGLGLGGGLALDPFGKDPALITRLEPLRDFLYERYWRVGVENAATLPSGPAILVANHAGALPLDGPVLALAISRERPDLQEARWLVEDQIFHAPFWGTLLNRLGAVRASPENALRLLEERRPVLVFPEGVQGTGKGYRERYRLKRFGRGGFVKLALRTGAPIVPVAIVGSEEATPMLAKLPGASFGLPYLPLTTPVPLPVRWALRFGAPIRLSPPEGDELAFVQHVTERTRTEIETMLQSLLRERRR